MRIKTVLFAALLGLPLASQAHLGQKHSVDARQHNQFERIQRGVETGALTQREARQLRYEQRAIRAEERRYRANGVLNARERAELHRELKDANRHIYYQKHDRAQRWW